MFGFRKIRERDFYADDSLVLCVLGLAQLPDTSAICRTLARFDQQAVDNVRGLPRTWVLKRLVSEQLDRVTLDFYGSIFSTRRHAEGTAIGSRFQQEEKGSH